MVDLTIKGAGIFGLMLGWAAVTRGAEVRIVDPKGPGAGASGGIVGALAPHTPDGWNTKKQLQLESLLAHRTLWPEIEAAGGVVSGFAAAGRIQPLLDENSVQLARARRQDAVANWGTAADWRVTTAPAVFAPPSPTGYWIEDTLSAHIHPRRACASLAAALRAKGADIAFEGPDEGAVIWATGADGLGDLNTAAQRQIGMPIKGQAILLAHDAAGSAQIYADGLHIIPHLDGTTAIGSTTERDYNDPFSTDAQLDEVLDKACRLVPALSGASVVERWAGLRPRVRSRAPLVGPWPDRPGHFIANGGFKIGFGMAPKVADLLIDLVLEDRDRVPDLFRLSASL